MKGNEQRGVINSAKAGFLQAWAAEAKLVWGLNDQHAEEYECGLAYRVAGAQHRPSLKFVKSINMINSKHYAIINFREGL